MRLRVIWTLALCVGGCAPIAATQAAPDVDDYVARSRCVRQEINRMLADPKEADRGSYDMASYAVGRCSRNKIMRSSSSPQRIDIRMDDEISERQNAPGMIIDAKTKPGAP